MAQAAQQQDVTVQKVKDQSQTRLPILEELSRRLADIERRAFSLFEGRGRALGFEMDDWLQAERETNGVAAAKLEETAQTYELSIELPGMKPEEIEIAATPDNLVVRAEHQEESKSPGSNAGAAKGEAKQEVWSEIRQTSVYRQIPLAAGIDVDNVTAKLENGVLRVSAKKAAGTEAAQPRRITVAA